MTPSTSRRIRWRDAAPLAVIALGLVVAMVLVALLNGPRGGEPVARYTSGRATLSLDGGTPVDLALEEHGATLSSAGGANVTWTSPDGWYLSIYGPSDATSPEPNGNLQRDGADFGGWAGFGSKTCAVDYTEVRPTRIAGSLRCSRLIWSDTSWVERVQPLDKPPFDLDVDFEASGDGPLPAPTPALD